MNSQNYDMNLNNYEMNYHHGFGSIQGNPNPENAGYYEMEHLDYGLSLGLQFNVSKNFNFELMARPNYQNYVLDYYFDNTKLGQEKGKIFSTDLGLSMRFYFLAKKRIKPYIALEGYYRLYISSEHEYTDNDVSTTKKVSPTLDKNDETLANEILGAQKDAYLENINVGIIPSFGLDIKLNTTFGLMIQGGQNLQTEQLNFQAGLRIGFAKRTTF